MAKMLDDGWTESENAWTASKTVPAANGFVAAIEATDGDAGFAISVKVRHGTYSAGTPMLSVIAEFPSLPPTVSRHDLMQRAEEFASDVLRLFHVASALLDYEEPEEPLNG